MENTGQKSYLQTLRTLAGALMGALLLIGVAVVTVLGGDATGELPVGWVAGVAGLGLLMTMLIPVVGYQIRPIAPGTTAEEAKSSARLQLQSSTILRFALAESVGIVAVAAAFVSEEGGLYPLLLGIGIAALLMLWHVWPGDRVLARVQQALEREGAQSYFREALDEPAPSAGS